jgi:hypothetical protein
MQVLAADSTIWPRSAESLIAMGAALPELTPPFDGKGLRVHSVAIVGPEGVILAERISNGQFN